jgi:hypothetical protein
MFNRIDYLRSLAAPSEAAVLLLGSNASRIEGVLIVL